MKIMDIKEDVPLMGDLSYCTICRSMDCSCGNCGESMDYFEEDNLKILCGQDKGSSTPEIKIHFCPKCVKNNGSSYKSTYKAVDATLVKM